jgi:peptidoglycan/xylan/chitin deacetylase (PgdA/CDA1 family)
VTAEGTLVLLYHRVARLPHDPHGLAVRPDRFAAHCEILRRRCEVVPLREATRSRRQVAITFDDGYADNAAEARSTLAAAGLPATFFITIGRVGHTGEAWWDRLEQIVLACESTADTIEIDVGGSPLWADIRSSTARERAHMAMFWRLRAMRPADIETILHELEVQLGVRSVPRTTHRWMTADELRALAATDGVDIGAHTVTHPFLRTLPADEQWTEIAGGREAIERLLGTRPSLFSYPHGSHDAFDAVTTGLVRKAGYTAACTATGGIARPDGDPLRIPRNVVGDWEGDVFERRLDQWLTQP